MEPENSQDLGENRTVFSVSHQDIAKTATRQCQKHTWKKLSECEIACTLCPTALIVGVDDERLVNLR